MELLGVSVFAPRQVARIMLLPTAPKSGRFFDKFDLQATLTKTLLALPAELVLDRYFSPRHARSHRQTQRTIKCRLRAVRGKSAERAAHQYGFVAAPYLRLALIFDFIRWAFVKRTDI